MGPFGYQRVTLAIHAVGDTGLSDVREQFGCGQEFALGLDHTLLSVKFHQGRAVITKIWPLHSEVSGGRGEKRDRIPHLAERIGVVASEGADIGSKERGDFLLERHDWPFG